MLRATADEGRTVLVSSHLLAEMAQTVDDVVVIHKGRVVRQGPVGELAAGARSATIVRSPQAERLSAALRDAGAEVTSFEDGALNVQGLGADAVGDAALAAGVAVHQLYESQASLEDAFFELTGGEAAT
jgi:ABC-2 type transport system ATP-binding protein